MKILRGPGYRILVPPGARIEITDSDERSRRSVSPLTYEARVSGPLTWVLPGDADWRRNGSAYRIDVRVYDNPDRLDAETWTRRHILATWRDMKTRDWPTGSLPVSDEGAIDESKVGPMTLGGQPAFQVFYFAFDSTNVVAYLASGEQIVELSYNQPILANDPLALVKRDVYAWVLSTFRLETESTQPAQPTAHQVPAGCLVRDADSLVYLNPKDGYCLRYPTGFRVGETPLHYARLVGPARTPGTEPIGAWIGVAVQALEPGTTLAEATDLYATELLRVGWLSDEYTRTLTVLGGQPAVLFKRRTEWTSFHTWLTVYGDKQYTLSIGPDAGAFPVVAEDVQAAWQTAPVSFSFLPPDFPELEPPPNQDPGLAAALPPTGTLRVWQVPRLVFQRQENSLWASALDGGAHGQSDHLPVLARLDGLQ